MAPARILVVDDDSTLRALMRRMLEGESYEVVEAPDGANALHIIQQNEVDLVLLDVMMPRMTGIDVCRKIRDDLHLLNLPIIFVTAMDDRDARVQGKQVGGNEFLTKPIDRNELLVRVENLLKVKFYNDWRGKQKELLQEELEQAKKLLFQAERLATLGTLAGSVGHELNNMLAVFGSALKMIKEHARQNKPASEEDIEMLDSVYGHLQTHTYNLLHLGRPGQDHEQRIDLRQVVENTSEILRLSGKLKQAKLGFHLPDDSVWVALNKTRVEQVLVNLIGNAVDATLESGKESKRVTIRLQVEKEYAVITVSDNGIGIPAEKLDSIFEAYFTTKPANKGTGLGLAVVYQIVHGYQGRLEVDSKVGEGTNIRVFFPIKADDTASV